MYVCMYMCVYVYVRTYVRTYACMYIYIYIYQREGNCLEALGRLFLPHFGSSLAPAIDLERFNKKYKIAIYGKVAKVESRLEDKTEASANRSIPVGDSQTDASS